MVPIPVERIPATASPVTVRRQRVQWTPDNLGILEIGRAQGAEHAVHQSSHCADAGPVHEAALRGRSTPGLGKGVLHSGPVGDEDGPDGTIVKAVVEILIDGETSGMEALLDRVG